jgi:hypothetical protein
MSLRISLLALLLSATSINVPSFAADDASFAKDLTATIALQGLPCDKVTQSKRNADSDYIAVCKDGNRYHVFVNANGRVIVQKL